MQFPVYRPRRMRRTKLLRRMIKETYVTPYDLVYPLFVIPGKGIKQEIGSMPGSYRFSVDKLVEEAKELEKLNINYIILFGIPETKDEVGSGGYSKDGIVQRAVKAVKDASNLVVITDVCMCEYTSHGHCGILKGQEVDNDATLEKLAEIALSQAQAGADIIAPSDMMDGRVEAIRTILDENGFEHIPILAYSAKYASGFYGPFREAAESTPQFGDRKSYQMDPANGREALREVMLDIQEGADMVMVKPAMPYLDIIKMVKEEFDYPVAAYQVSGEYAMIKAAGKLGWIDETRIMIESLTCIKRAGADIILTYFAKEISKLL
jgi:porphobilinogen synthase